MSQEKATLFYHRQCEKAKMHQKKLSQKFQRQNEREDLCENKIQNCHGLISCYPSSDISEFLTRQSYFQFIKEAKIIYEKNQKELREKEEAKDLFKPKIISNYKSSKDSITNSIDEYNESIIIPESPKMNKIDNSKFNNFKKNENV